MPTDRGFLHLVLAVTDRYSHRMFWVMILVVIGMPVGAVIYGYCHLRNHPEDRAAARRVSEDQWGPF